MGFQRFKSLALLSEVEFRGLLDHDTNLDEKWCQENALNKTFYNYAHYQSREKTQ